LPPRDRGERVTKQSKDETLIKIEETQTALRECIERAKNLSEQSERLVRKHRDEMSAPEPPKPG
jgi:hypothetical protein